MPRNQAELYLFEGGYYSALEIQKMMPVYSIKTIRSYLREDPAPVTKQAIHAIAHQRQVNSKSQAKKNATAGGLDNSAFFVKKGKTNG